MPGATFSGVWSTGNLKKSICRTAPPPNLILRIRLDFRRFSSDMIREFQQVQLEVLRQLSPGRPITHNFMGGFTDFEHFEVAGRLGFCQLGRSILWAFSPPFLSFRRSIESISFVQVIRTSLRFTTTSIAPAVGVAGG